MSSQISGLGNVRQPSVLDLTYNPSGLWVFDGDLIDLSPTGEDLSVDNGTIQYSLSHEHGRQCVRLKDNQVRLRGSNPAPSELVIDGDITVQIVFMMDTTVGTDSFGTHLIGCISPGGSGAEVNNDVWSLELSDVSTEMTPKWSWEYGAGNRQTSQPTDFKFALGQWYHMVCVRESEGGGTSAARTYVNGQLILETTGLTDATGGGSSRIVIGRDENDAGQGWLGGMLSSAKVVDRALTDREIKYEWLRVSGEFLGDRL